MKDKFNMFKLFLNLFLSQIKAYYWGSKNNGYNILNFDKIPLVNENLF